ncbi:hypothetical protein WICPIJ_008601 [Wickerhamomyces pijperi]|uniref:Pre-mRNA-splicing factor SYF1 n=1 Tax=Wickerhamomyces pijperi TaxID=599730 RepID=A0A9P8PWB4_WICPI|nr:hypothetical protein WICPIJ_008601 [Wickerhamomyces pijperi]
MTTRHTLDSHLILPTDLPFEHQLQATPTDESLWIQYANTKDTTSSTQLEKCYILRRALSKIPHSEKIWMAYLEERVGLLRGLNPIVGEHRDDFGKVKEEFELCLSYLRESLDIWEAYLSFLERMGDFQSRRAVLNQMLKILPLEKHEFVWRKLLEFADEVKGKIATSIYSRYLIYKPFELELVLEKFIEFDAVPQALKLLEQILNDDTFVSQQDKTPWDYFSECLDLLTQSPTEYFGLTDTFIRQGLIKFPTQYAELFVTLAQHYREVDFQKTKSIYQEALSHVKSLQQFTIIFESFTNALESEINKLMNITQGTPSDSTNSASTQLDINLQILETLLDQQPYLISDIKLRASPNDVSLWLDRITLVPDTQIELKLQTYVKAITTIKPEHSTPGLSQIWLGYSRVYEDYDDLQTAREILDRAVKVSYNNIDELVEVWLGWSSMELRRDDLETALRVMEVATRIPEDFKTIKIDDLKLSVQKRLFKSVKLWSFYLDLKESLVEDDTGVKETCALYEKLFELRIITPLILINYASFLSDQDRYEQSFRIYERGVKLFTYPVVFEIWNVYLVKLLSRDPSLERVREVFDRALEGSPGEFLKVYVTMYSDYEFKHGSFDKSIKILKTSIDKIPNEDKLEIFINILTKYQQHDQLNQIRETYQDIVTIIPLTKCLTYLKDFIHFETELKEYTRVRELYQYALSQLRSRPLIDDLFNSWSDFEVSVGDKSSYKQMLKFKRQIEESFELKDVDYQEQDIGFVKSSDGPKVSSINASEDKSSSSGAVNPDVIDIDLDI